MKKLVKLKLIALVASLVILNGCQSVLGAGNFWDAGTDPSYFQAKSGIFQYPDIPWGSSAADIEKAAGHPLNIGGRNGDALPDEPRLYALKDEFFIWDNKYASIILTMGGKSPGINEVTFTFTPEMKLSNGKTQKLDLNGLFQDLEKSFTESYGEPTDTASMEKPSLHVTAWRTFLTQENGRYISNSIALRFLGTEEKPSKVSIEISNTLMAPEFSPEQLKRAD